MSSKGAKLPRDIQIWLKEVEVTKSVGDSEVVKEAMRKREIDATNSGKHKVIFIVLYTLIHVCVCRLKISKANGSYGLLSLCSWNRKRLSLLKIALPNPGCSFI
jgi:hypothetical protein